MQQIYRSSSWHILPGHFPENKKLVTISQNWEIRLVFTKGRHHGWQQENFFWYNLQNARKCYPGKKIFQSMTLHNTHKSPLRNVFSLIIINLVGIWKKINRHRFWLDKSSKWWIKWKNIMNCNQLSKNIMARYTSI